MVTVVVSEALLLLLPLLLLLLLLVLYKKCNLFFSGSCCCPYGISWTNCRNGGSSFRPVTGIAASPGDSRDKGGTFTMNIEAGTEHLSFVISSTLFHYLDLSRMCECTLCVSNLEIFVGVGVEAV
jgi:hypothetical protein